MNKPEAQLYKYLRDSVFCKVNGMAWDRIETSTAVGIPDIYYNRFDQHGWIELKAIKSLKDRQLTEVQRHWLYERGKAGNCWVIMQVGNMVYLIESWEYRDKSRFSSLDELQGFPKWMKGSTESVEVLDLKL